MTKPQEALISAWAEAQMRVQGQSRAMPNVFNVGNVVKRLIWTRMGDFGLFGVGEELQIIIATPTGRNLCLRDGEDYRANSLGRRTPPAASGRQFASHW